MLEFWLIFLAWRRGWKGWALVPSAVGYLLLALLDGMSYDSDVSGLMLLVAVGVFGALIFMIVQPRSDAAPSRSESASLPPEPVH